MTINYDIDLKNVKIKFAQMDVNLGYTLSQVVRSTIPQFQSFINTYIRGMIQTRLVKQNQYNNIP